MLLNKLIKRNKRLDHRYTKDWDEIDDALVEP